MRRALITAFAMLAAVLVMTATPVMAANTVVGSVHTTDTDFNNASTLENVTIDGSGQGASVSWIGADGGDTFESGNINSYGGDTGSATVQSTTVFEGQYALEMSTASGDVKIGDTDQPVAQGETFGTRVRLGGAETGSFLFAWQKETGSSDPNGYGISVNNNAGQLNILRWTGSGTQTTLSSSSVAIPDDKWVFVKVEWKTDNTIIATLYDASGSQIGQVQATDNTYTSGGIGYSAFESSVQFDARGAGDGTYIGAAHSVDDASGGFANLTLSNASATVTWQQSTDGGSTWTDVANSTYTTSGNRTIALSGDGQWRVNVTFEKTGSNPTAGLHDEGVKFTNNDPSVSLTNPSDGAQLGSQTVTLKAQVNDSDFPNTQGDTVTGEFKVKGPGDSSYSTVGTDSRSSNGTISVQYDAVDGGTYDWRVDPVTDSYGGSNASGTRQFTVPSTLYIRNETNADQLVKNANVTVRFFEGGNETVVERTTSDGTLDLTGLPVGQKFIVTASAQNYSRRTTIIDDIFSQNSMYLLSENVSSVEVRFTLEDNTGGNFPQESTEILIKKPINRSNETKFRTVAADEVGVQGFTTILEEDIRYRITARNNQGDTRTLGAYTTTVSETVKLTIGEVTYDARSDTKDYEWDATHVGDGSNAKIKFNYSDPEGATGDIQLEIWEYQNKSNNTIVNTTLNGPHGKTSYTEPLTAAQANKTWVVRWSADRNNEKIGAKRVLGGQGPLGIVLDDLWKHSIAAGSIFVFAGLFGGLRKELGVIVVPLIAGIWWYIGWLPTAVGAGAILLALTIGVLVNVRDRGGP